MNYLPATSGVSQGTSLSGTRVDAIHPEPRADAAQAPAVPRRRGRSLSVGQTGANDSSFFLTVSNKF